MCQLKMINYIHTGEIIARGNILTLWESARLMKLIHHCKVDHREHSCTGKSIRSSSIHSLKSAPTTLFAGGVLVALPVTAGRGKGCCTLQEKQAIETNPKYNGSYVIVLSSTYTAYPAAGKKERSISSQI